MATAKVLQKKDTNKTTKKKPEKTKEEIKAFKKKKFEFEEKFYELMFELNLYNKFDDTYWLNIIEETNYGFYAQLYLKTGLTFTELQQKQGAIQQSLNCLWIMKTQQFRNYADIQIVTQPLDEEIPYVNPNVKPHQMYLGLDLTMKPIVIDMHDYCMYLLAGATGSGKTFLIYQILLSWILGCTPKQVEIYLGDIAKNEYINFQYVEHVKYYAYELEQLAEMVGLLEKEFQRRKRLLSITREQGIATNVKEYNKIFKEKLSTIIILNDEFSVLLPDKTDSEEEKEMKQKVLDSLKRLSKMGRNMAMFTFEALQKTVKDEIPSIIKSQSAVRISLRANDSVSSEVIMGDNSAVGLSKRYGVYSLNGGEEKNYLFSPNLTTERLNELLRPFIKEKHRPKQTNKPTTPIIEVTTQISNLPKQMTPYNQNSGYTPQPIIWNLEAKFRPYKKQNEEIVETSKPPFNNNGDDDCIDY